MFWKLFGSNRRIEEALRQQTRVENLSPFPANDASEQPSKLELWSDYQYDEETNEKVLQQYWDKNTINRT